MPDRCYFQVRVRKSDAEAFAERVFGSATSQDVAVTPQAVVFEIPEASEPYWSETKQAGLSGLTFYGMSGEGPDYGARCFAAHAGEYAETDALTNPIVPAVRFDEIRMSLDPIALRNASHYARIASAARAVIGE